jgi:hypothetical protein
MHHNNDSHRDARTLLQALPERSKPVLERHKYNL